MARYWMLHLDNQIGDDRLAPSNSMGTLSQCPNELEMEAFISDYSCIRVGLGVHVDVEVGSSFGFVFNFSTLTEKETRRVSTSSIHLCRPRQYITHTQKNT